MGYQSCQKTNHLTWCHVPNVKQIHSNARTLKIVQSDLTITLNRSFNLNQRMVLFNGQQNYPIRPQWTFLWGHLKNEYKKPPAGLRDLRNINIWNNPVDIYLFRMFQFLVRTRFKSEAFWCEVKKLEKDYKSVSCYCI